jgi:hypothetical protein
LPCAWKAGAFDGEHEAFPVDDDHTCPGAKEL